jgi:hypothetical protein
MPLAPASISGSSAVCPGATGLAYSTAQVSGFTYTWTVPAGCTIINGQGTNAITVNWGSSAGIILVKAHNACGASANRAMAVTLLSCMPMEPNDPFDVSKDSDLEIFPNPSNGDFTIRSAFGGDFFIQNELGQTVQYVKLNEMNAYQEDVKGLTNGLYFIVGTHEGEVVSQKILVSH